MMKLIGLALAVSCFVSCTSNKVPDDVLSQPKTIAVMWDLMRADEYLINYVRKDSGYDKKNETLKLYNQVYYIHKTTKQQVAKSLDYYNRQPVLFKAILDSLEKRKTHLMQDTYNKRNADSLKKRVRLNTPK